MAKISDVVPYIDAQHFPSGTYPMHDLQAATDFLFPDFYNVTRIAANIGDVGQIIVNPNANDTEKNVYVLGMPVEKQSIFYQTVLAKYQQFDCINNSCQPINNQLTVGKIIGIVASGVVAMGLTALGAFGLYKWHKKKKIENGEYQAILVNNL